MRGRVRLSGKQASVISDQTALFQEKKTIVKAAGVSTRDRR
jgi:hypothetical protein